jgi:enamine deaminase RidA (YjgF/YER057c/UK114 family)
MTPPNQGRDQRIEVEKRSRLERQRFSGPSPYEGRIGFSRAIRVGNIVLVSGTAPIGPDGRTACRGDAFGQSMRCMEIIRAALEDAGSRLEDVVRVRMYISDVRNSEAVSEAFRSVFGEIRPTATMLICRLLEEDWLVEMEADAILESADSFGIG